MWLFPFWMCPPLQIKYHLRLKPMKDKCLFLVEEWNMGYFKVKEQNCIFEKN